MYNVWRSTDLERDIYVMPLAICDMATVAKEDIIAADAWSQTETPRRLVSLRLVHSPNQRWYYFPRMTPQETLIFKQYDTRQEKSNMRTAFHGAIDDPTTPENAPLRKTIEVRLLALFDEDAEREARKARFQAEVPETTLTVKFLIGWRNNQVPATCFALLISVSTFMACNDSSLSYCGH